jgi:hypothetical protein
MIAKPKLGLSRSPSTRYNAPGSAVKVFAAAGDLLFAAAQQASPEKAKMLAKAEAIEAAKAAQAKPKISTTTRPTTTTSIRSTTLMRPAPWQMSTIVTTRQSTLKTTSTQPTQPSPRTQQAKHGGSKHRRLVLFTTAAVVAAVLLLRYCKIAEMPLYLHCWMRLKDFLAKPAQEDDGVLQRVASGGMEEVVRRVDDARLMRALVHGAT